MRIDDRTSPPSLSAMPECAPQAAIPAQVWMDKQIRAGLARATGGLSVISASLAGLDWALQLGISPAKIVQAWQVWLQHSIEDWPRLLPTAAEPPSVDLSDQRFADAGWQDWPYRCWRDAFMRNEAFWESLTQDIDGLSRHHQHIVAFCARQWLDLLAPGNVWWMNPTIARTASSTFGANFLQGAHHWLQDASELLSKVPGLPAGRPALEFLPGRDVARTPGKVVFRNALIELIEYAPALGANTVWREPVLIVPSWIMRYYILDLKPEDSLVRYLVESGHTVFMISWKNPDASARDFGLDTYLEAGLLTALNTVHARCDGAHVHAAGYCLGGTLLATGAAMLARDAAGGPLASMTLFAAETDFHDPGELGLFIDKSSLATLDALMWSQGYLDGPQMKSAFQMLNAQDLIWSRVMSEYLLGQRLRANDLVSWNRDTTRLPYRLHSECLHKLFLGNELATGKLCVGGQPVALSDLDLPLFVVGTEHDHVSPWRSVYKLHLLTKAELTFLLTSGGHNAGIVSEPGHPGRRYHMHTRLPAAPYLSPEQFLNVAVYRDGSWWPAWHDWLVAHSTARCTRQAPGQGLADAPGTYVLEP
ncbi:Poly(3-hydroxybutyrate) polymerase [Cupriavidus sp. GA3-3]|nr:Poly(3-hydroxybutyrate) polymerase [Cupriavidus sp. GA3-3]